MNPMSPIRQKSIKSLYTVLTTSQHIHRLIFITNCPRYMLTCYSPSNLCTPVTVHDHHSDTLQCTHQISKYTAFNYFKLPNWSNNFKRQVPCLGWVSLMLSSRPAHSRPHTISYIMWIYLTSQVNCGHGHTEATGIENDLDHDLVFCSSLCYPKSFPVALHHYLQTQQAVPFVKETTSGQDQYSYPQWGEGMLQPT